MVGGDGVKPAAADLLKQWCPLRAASMRSSCSAVGFHDPACYRQAEAGSTMLRREECIERFIPHVGWHPGSAIDYRDTAASVGGNR